MSTNTTGTTSGASAPKIVEVDTRGRLSVGRLVEPGQFVASVGPDGSLLLEPAVVTTALEAQLRESELYQELASRRERLDEAVPVSRDHRRRTAQSGQ